MNKNAIERQARDLQKAIWHQRDLLAADQRDNPHLVTNPLLGLAVCGYRYIERESLGRFGSVEGRFEVAGYFDRETRTVVVSNRFPEQTKLFTTAHEIGHIMMHSEHSRHRDIPISGLSHGSGRRQPIEVEADYFSGCYLIPRKLLLREFTLRFGMAPFSFDDRTAWHLMPEDPDSLLRDDVTTYTRAIRLATATSFNGRHFRSLAQAFSVSVATMAIRIEDVGLIRYP